MSILTSKNVIDIILKTLSIVNKEHIQHGQIVGYLLYEMMKDEKDYTRRELMDYTLIGILHDLGLCKEESVELKQAEVTDVGPHSLYGYLFIKFLSPLGNKADIIKYHHVNYNHYNILKIDPKDRKVLELLSVVDKMDLFRRGMLPKDYFQKNRDITFSGKALDAFLNLEKRKKLLEKLADGSYQNEMDRLWNSSDFTEDYKKRFLEMIVYIIDFRSEVTVIHTMSTVFFAKQLGIIMQVGTKDLENITYGALLHDIGKIDIPLEILESTGRLSDDEMEIMKSHVVKTEEILEGTIDESILKIAVRHHEKLDGSGYPRGLTENELSLNEQIVAVADILSALYGKRSYKEAFDKEKIQEILVGDAVNGKISHFVVHKLLLHYDAVIESYEQEKQNIIGLYLNIKKDYSDLHEVFKSVV